MADDETPIPGAVLEAQRAADAAWTELETYRKAVTERRRAESPDDPERLPRQGRPLRPWSDEEDAEYERLRQTALAAAETRRRAMADAGVTSTYKTEAAIRAAVCETAEA